MMKSFEQPHEFHNQEAECEDGEVGRLRIPGWWQSSAWSLSVSLYLLFSIPFYLSIYIYS